MAHSYAVREQRISRERHAQVNLCGDCGTQISATELLCRECRQRPMIGDEETAVISTIFVDAN